MAFLYESSESAGIELDGATINAGKVKIEAKAEEASYGEIFASDINPFLGVFVETLFASLKGFLDLVSPVSLSIRTAEANVSIIDSSITSSGDIQIDAMTSADSVAVAVKLLALLLPVSVNVVYTEAETSSIIDISGRPSASAKIPRSAESRIAPVPGLTL